MRALPLRARIAHAFLVVLAGLTLFIAAFGYYSIRRNIVERAQHQVQIDLRSARTVYQGEIDQMRMSLDLISRMRDSAGVKTRLDLDYVGIVDLDQNDTIPNSIVARAFRGVAAGGTRLIDSTELRRIGEDVAQQAHISIKPTAKARPTARTQITSALAMECAVPCADATGRVWRVMYGGKILNRNFELIDKMHSIVYESRLYGSKPEGTVTIFQDDVRIATNVLTSEGTRAIGTRVSSEVYANVVEKGRPWIDRAFVVTDWYLTAYEPLRDVNGAIIGILYVGILEKPFTDLMRSSLVVFLLIMGGAGIVAVALSFLLAGAVTSPLTRLVKASSELADGDLSHRVSGQAGIREIRDLAGAFNNMADSLQERDASLTKVNNDLAAANARYLDLVGMVSHELKGTLSSTMLNTLSVRDGHLGALTPAQQKALDSIARNLEHFDLAVKNFLNLSRIERGELELHRQDLLVKEDLLEISVDVLAGQAQQRRMKITVNAPQGSTVTGDAFLLLTVVNNLLGNAIAYGAEGGLIALTVLPRGSHMEVEVYNDGRPIASAEQERLFKRFSRLDSPEGRRVRGTGLGLFLCKVIVERHGGSIRCEPREGGNAFVITLPAPGEQQGESNGTDTSRG